MATLSPTGPTPRVVILPLAPRAVMLPLAQAAQSTTLTPAQVAKTWKAAQDFEAMALDQFLSPIFNTVDMSKSKFGGGDGEATWKPMLVTEIARSIASHGGLGIAAPVFTQMLRQQEDAAAASTHAQPEPTP
jgi:Rod binding domain-containing protein